MSIKSLHYEVFYVDKQYKISVFHNLYEIIEIWIIITLSLILACINPAFDTSECLLYRFDCLLRSALLCLNFRLLFCCCESMTSYLERRNRWIPEDHQCQQLLKLLKDLKLDLSQ